MKSIVRFVVRCFILVLLLPIILSWCLSHVMVVFFDWLARITQGLEDLLGELTNKYCNYCGPIFRGGKK